MKYHITGTVTVSCFTTVEADTEDEAREIAAQRGLAGLTHQPFDADSDEAWHMDADGEPQMDAAGRQLEASEIVGLPFDATAVRGGGITARPAAAFLQCIRHADCARARACLRGGAMECAVVPTQLAADEIAGPPPVPLPNLPQPLYRHAALGDLFDRFQMQQYAMRYLMDCEKRPDYQPKDKP